jgi:hypothetical protein
MEQGVVSKRLDPDLVIRAYMDMNINIILFRYKNKNIEINTYIYNRNTYAHISSDPWGTKSKQGPAFVFNHHYLSQRKSSKKSSLNTLEYQQMVVMGDGSYMA